MGASAGIMMATSMGISAVSGLANTYNQSQAFKSQGDIQKQISEMNSQLAEFQSKDALHRGEKAVFKHREGVKALIGAQRVAQAAQGIDTESGSALEIVGNTQLMSETDVQTIKNNAWRESWGYKVESISSSLRGEISKLSGESNARNTLLTGGMDALSSGLKAGYYYKNPSNLKYAGLGSV
jgi:hypothetical protein